MPRRARFQRRYVPRPRIDTPGEANGFRHGEIMQYVLRSLLD